MKLLRLFSLISTWHVGLLRRRRLGNIPLGSMGVFFCVGAGSVSAGEREDAVSFYKDVRPIFVENCQGCHQPAKAQGKFIITSYAKLMEGVPSGDEKVVSPGKPGDSLLLAEITPEDGEASMPKGADPLTDAQISLIRRWVEEGAKDDTPASAVDVSEDNPPIYENLPVVTGLDYSPDGELIAVSGYHEVLLHKADGSELVARLIGSSERVQSVKFSPDGKYLAVTGGNPGVVGEVQIWDVAKRKLRTSKVITYDTIYGASWSRDGKLLAFGCGDNSVRVIDARSGEQVLFQGAHGDWVLGTTFSTDSTHLVSVSRDRSMKLIKVENQQFIDNITSITPGALKGGLMAVDCHPKEDHLLSCGADGQPKIYRMFREKARRIGDDFNLIQQFEAMPGRIFDGEFDAEGKRIVVGSSSSSKGEVRVYPAGSAGQGDESAKTDEKKAKTDKPAKPEKVDTKPTWVLPLGSAVYAVAFSPDGKAVAAAGFGGQVYLVDAETGKVTQEFVPVPLEAKPEVRRRRF